MVTIASCTPESAADLAKETDCSTVPGADAGRAAYDVLVNGTLVGMRCDGLDLDEAPISADRLRPSAVIIDTVYDLVETRLLREVSVLAPTPLPASNCSSPRPRASSFAGAAALMRRIALERLAVR